MVHSSEVVWLTVSPSLKHFDQPLLRYLAQQATVAQWEYCQDEDEASSLETAIALLHEYLQLRDRSVHLAGHGMGGVLGLEYARRYPEHVQSLALLAVAAQPAATWHSHYYVQRQLLPCSRPQLLAQMVRSLFGTQPPFAVKDLVAALSRDLEEVPSAHSLFNLVRLPQGGVSMPLLVCSSRTDSIVNSTAVDEWSTWLKPQDQLYQCLRGRHFFHYFYPELVGKKMISFWQLQTSQPAMLSRYC